MLNLSYEKSLWDKGVYLIAGVDEVGRGALAGPMVVCAVILDTQKLKETYYIYKDALEQLVQINNDIGSFTNNDVIKLIKNLRNKKEHKEEKYNQLINYLSVKDSKQLTPNKRTEIAKFIKQVCISYSIHEISNKHIDNMGISACTQEAFYESVQKLKVAPEHILTDSFPINKYPTNIQTNIKHGDRISITISAASILAKVYRDNLMIKLGRDPKYKIYEFEKHKGYGTKLHIQKIKEYGISNLHRKSFIHNLHDSDNNK